MQSNRRTKSHTKAKYKNYEQVKARQRERYKALTESARRDIIRRVTLQTKKRQQQSATAIIAQLGSKCAQCGVSTIAPTRYNIKTIHGTIAINTFTQRWTNSDRLHAIAGGASLICSNCKGV